MAVIFDEEKQTLTLNTDDSSYQMKISPHGLLLHTWYGPGIRDDMSYLINFRDRGFSGQLDDFGTDRTWSADVLPQEYPGSAVGDYRSVAIDVSDSDGPVGADLRYRSHRILPGKYRLSGMPAVYAADDEAQTLEVNLRDNVTGLEVRLLYGAIPKLNVITRAAELTNTGTGKLTIHRAESVCLDWLHGDYDLIHFYGRQGGERKLERDPVGHGKVQIGSRRGMSSHMHSPFAILAGSQTNEDSGPAWGVSLVWSGNFEIGAQRDHLEQTRLTAGLGDFGYPLAPGETIVLPEAILSFSSRGLAKLSQQYHRTIREHLVRGPWKLRRRPVLLNSWEAVGFDFNRDKLEALADEAASLDMEMLVLDDGWFGKRESDNSGLGDWKANEEKLGGSLADLSDSIHRKGLQFGLWFEPEMVSEDSDFYRRHPDYVLRTPGRRLIRGRNQLVLDFSRPEVRESIFNQMTAILDSARIDYVKWDMNRCVADAFEPGGGRGSGMYRYVLGVYDFMERLLARYPALLLETCAGGGGRFDAGMLYYSPQIWCSDNTDPIERLSIQYGTSFGFPVSAVGSHVPAKKNGANGRVTSLKTRAAVAAAGNFGYELDLTKLTEDEKKEIRSQTARYKQDWNLIHNGNYYRLTDVDKDREKTAWLFVSQDRDQAMLEVVTTDAHFKAPTEYVTLKGLDPDGFYRDIESGRIRSGAALMSGGLFLPRFDEEYSSWILRLERVEDHQNLHKGR